MIIYPKIFTSFENLCAIQTTRLGGFSTDQYASLNLGTNTQDSIETINKNKNHLAQKLGIHINNIAKARQIHGTEILKANKGGSYDGFDAIITNHENVFACVSTADCVPILIYDPEHKVCAAIHAGWKGTKDYLTSLTLEKMYEEFGTESKRSLAYIGACIGECSFQVDADVATYFDDPFCRYDSKIEKYFIDLKAHNRAQLIRAGLSEKSIEVSPYDTYEQTDLFYSHRKEKGQTGRMWALIGMKDERA